MSHTQTHTHTKTRSGKTINTQEGHNNSMKISKMMSTKENSYDKMKLDPNYS